MNYNRAIIAGRCVEKPELKTIGSGTEVTNFTVATSRKYKDKEETEFHKVVLWGKLAQVASSFLDKGSPVLIEGRLFTRKWEKDGQKHSVTEIIGEELQLGPKPQASHPVASAQEAPEDLPF